MQINFYPERNDKKLEKETNEYSKIWKQEGKKIVKEIEKFGGIKFKEKIINAIVFDGISYASPLSLSAFISADEKRASITHELCHRLIAGNNIEAKPGKNYNETTINFHKQVNLILFDIWNSLYGEKFAKNMVKWEINLWNREGESPYKTAWNWALNVTKQERQKEFERYLK